MSSDQPVSDLRVLVLQGGGALGAYQGGVYEALMGAGVEPDWIAGISIGAINSAILVGNPPEKRLERLREFWDTVSWGPAVRPPRSDEARSLFNETNAAWTAALGVPGMFQPRFPPAMFQPPGAPGAISVYDTSPLRETLERVVDFDRINQGDIRLSMGAVHITTGNFVYFDNRRQRIGPEHVMASGALPPGFPPIEIEGEYYWDGGVVSNTPLEYVLDQEAEENLLIFQVDLFSAHGAMPRNILEAVEREKEIRYSSRTRLNTDANLRIQRLKKALCDLVKDLPEDDPKRVQVSELTRQNTVKVLQLIYRGKGADGYTRDYDFARSATQGHWAAGSADAHRMLSRIAHYQRAPIGGAEAFDPGHEDNPA